MSRKCAVLGLVALVGLLAAGRADALTQYTDRAAFNAQGAIVYNYGFEGVPLDPYGFY